MIFLVLLISHVIKIQVFMEIKEVLLIPTGIVLIVPLLILLRKMNVRCALGKEFFRIDLFRN